LEVVLTLTVIGAISASAPSRPQALSLLMTTIMEA